jgi:tetratricopeptide (TPR) repeat protein
MRMTHRSRSVAVLLALAAAVTVAGCDALDPTDVENPQTTEENLRGAEQQTSVLLEGLRVQFARALGATVVTTEFASDNFSINGTGLGGNALDFPRSVGPNVAVINTTNEDGMYWNLQELRAEADYLLEEVAPDDDNATQVQIGEARYLRGMAFLIQGENFAAVPTEEDTTATPAAGLLANAQSDFSAALQAAQPGSDLAVQTNAALARTHRALGNATEARRFAQDALDAGGSTFLIDQPYDADNLDNPPHDYLVQRSLQEMQPLPRLDFLDPKYTAEDTPIPVASAEEMRLILAEVALADDRPADARAHLRRAIGVAADRGRVTFEDGDERLDNNLNVRPDTTAIQVRFAPDAPLVDGLVLDRPGTVTVPAVSGTHVTAAQVDGASGTDLTRLLYLLRQELLLLEGHRLHDLGIRLPIMLREIETSPVIDRGDPGTQVTVPDYIPPEKELDEYTPTVIYDDSGALTTTEVTMLHDMNRVLAEERGLVVENPMLPGAQ